MKVYEILLALLLVGELGEIPARMTLAQEVRIATGSQ